LPEYQERKEKIMSLKTIQREGLAGGNSEKKRISMALPAAIGEKGNQRSSPLEHEKSTQTKSAREEAV